MTFHTNWKLAEIDALRIMWARGNSLKEIGAALNRPWKSIAHKRRRLGLTARVTEQQPPKMFLKRPPDKPKPFSGRVAVKRKGVKLEARTGCCFIVSDGSPHRYCNGHVSNPRSDGMWQYCDAHLTVMRDRTANAKSHHPKAVKAATKFVDKVYNAQIAKTDAPVFDRVAA
jgi:hypothetical protein